MKKCLNCNTITNDETLACNFCGGADFEPINLSGQQNANNQGEIKGNVKPWQVLVIAIGCIALVIAALSAVLNIFVGGYTKGEIVDGVYVNEWADMKFEFYGNWKDVTALEYRNYEETDVECGFVAEGLDNLLVVTFQNLGNTIGYSEDQGVRDYMDGYKEELESETGVTVNVSEPERMTIGGNGYSVIKVDVMGFLSQYACVRFKDGYGIVIMVSATSEADVIEVLEAFTTAD
jgi:hypothetical protein